MKIKINYNQLGGMAPAQWLRRAGYAYIVDHRSGQDSFVRRLSRDFYPRFHLYIQEIPGSEELYFNLHLDQKQASYAGVTRHSGEYEGELAEEEAKRLRSLLRTTIISGADNGQRPEKPKSMWQKLFS